MYVGMYAYVFVCVHEWVSMAICLCVRVYIRMYIYVFACVCV
jgi:hypothetical protein